MFCCCTVDIRKHYPCTGLMLATAKQPWHFIIQNILVWLISPYSWAIKYTQFRMSNPAKKHSPKDILYAVEMTPKLLKFMRLFNLSVDGNSPSLITVEV